MGGVYYILQGSVGFDNLKHGKSPKGSQKQRSHEDYGKWLSAGLSPVMSGSGRRACMLTGSNNKQHTTTKNNTTQKKTKKHKTQRGATTTEMRCWAGWCR